MKTSLRLCFAPLLLCTTALSACGRDELWDTPPSQTPVLGLTDAAVVIDDTAHRALFLEVAQDLTLAPVSVPIGHGYAASATTPDDTQLLVLSRGDVPRKKAPKNQSPKLQILHAGAKPAVDKTFPLSDPLSGLAVDPRGTYAIVYPSASDATFVANPNELSIVDIGAAPGPNNPIPLTLRSFGGRPQGFFFTQELDVVGQSRRLLTVLTDRDLGIIDLSAPTKGDITVPLSSTGARPLPVQIAATNGLPGVDDARLAVRLAADSNVILVDLLPVPPGDAGTTAHDFRPTPNIVFAGGQPSDIAFVNTDGGLRLAALVPSNQALALIDPTTGISTDVDLGGSFEKLSLVTDIVGPTASGADVALLWSTSSTEIAFVALGSTVGKPYKSVERVTLDGQIAQVVDVPAPNQHLKVLVGPTGNLYVLDLETRTVAPLLTSSGYGGTAVTLSPDGQRAWITAPNAQNIASLDFATLHPKNFTLASPATSTFDVTKKGGGRAVLAIRGGNPQLDLTLLDGLSPSADTAIDYPSILLGELP